MITALPPGPSFAFVELFEAGVEPENMASRRCLEAAGFRPRSQSPTVEGMLYYRAGGEIARGRDEVDVTIRIPPQLADAVDEDDYPDRWVARRPPGIIEEIASEWALELGDPYLPGGQCAWVAPARNRAGEELVLKVGWRHREAEHEADALRSGTATAPSAALDTNVWTTRPRCCSSDARRETSSDARSASPSRTSIIAGLLRRLWARHPRARTRSARLQEMCDQWADWFELDFATDRRGLDPGLAREGIGALRELPATADRRAAVHRSARRERPRRRPRAMAGDRPQAVHRRPRLTTRSSTCSTATSASPTDPAGLSRPDGGPARRRPRARQLWLFARCAQESLHDPTMREPARRLAP